MRLHKRGEQFPYIGMEVRITKESSGPNPYGGSDCNRVGQVTTIEHIYDESKPDSFCATLPKLGHTPVGLANCSCHWTPFELLEIV